MMSFKIIRILLLVWAMIFVAGTGVGEADTRAIVNQTWTQSVGQQIPDGPPGGGSGTPLLSTIDVPLGSIVVGVEVYLNISMVDWTSDLITRLTSPGGTTVGVSWIGEGGEPATNIIGWYPLDFTPHNSFDVFIGEYTEGVWTLDCRDYSNSAVGTLNEWRLRLTYDDTVDAEPCSFGQIKALYR
jgi:subtilisin-like proprotein convertase family protein